MKLFLKKITSFSKHDSRGFSANTHRGFTLMEVMVSISIFAIIITIGIGSLLTIFKTLQQTRADRQTLDSVSYIMDTMTRRIRTARTIVVESDTITLTDQDGEKVVYSVTLDGSDPETGTTYILTTTDDQIPGGSYNLTPEDFKITNMEFQSYNDQPLVYIRLAGYAVNGTRKTEISLQTAVSKRSFE